MYLYPKDYKEPTKADSTSPTKEEIKIEARKLIKSKPIHIKDFMNQLEKVFVATGIHLSSDKLKEIALDMMSEFPAPKPKDVELPLITVEK